MPQLTFAGASDAIEAAVTFAAGPPRLDPNADVQ